MQRSQSHTRRKKKKEKEKATQEEKAAASTQNWAGKQTGAHKHETERVRGIQLSYLSARLSGVEIALGVVDL